MNKLSKKIHFVSCEYGEEEVWNYLIKSGMDEVILTYSNETIVEKLRKLNINFSIIELSINSIFIICIKLNKEIKKIRKKYENPDIILGVGTGNLYYESACYVLGCLDSEIKVRYIGDENGDEIKDVETIPSADLNDTEINLLRYLVGQGGEVNKIKKIAKFLIDETPSWYNMPKKASKNNKEKNRIRAITNNLSRRHLKSLKEQGCIKMKRKGFRTNIKITNFGRLMVDLSSDIE